MSGVGKAGGGSHRIGAQFLSKSALAEGKKAFGKDSKGRAVVQFKNLKFSEKVKYVLSHMVFSFGRTALGKELEVYKQSEEFMGKNFEGAPDTQHKGVGERIGENKTGQVDKPNGMPGQSEVRATKEEVNLGKMQEFAPDFLKGENEVLKGAMEKAEYTPSSRGDAHAMIKDALVGNFI